MELTYKQLFQKYTPEEQGDFFVMYNTDKGGFVIHSPEQNKVSCFALSSLTALSVFDLSVIFDYIFAGDEKDEDEFSFDFSASKEKILTYFFDIQFLDSDTLKFQNYVRPYSGYGLNEKNKLRNILNIEDNALLFDNQFCYIDNSNDDSRMLMVTFDAKKYDDLICDKTLNGEFHVFLLSGANNYLFDILPDKQISLLIGREPAIFSLKLLVYILNKKKEVGILLDVVNQFVHLGFHKDIYSPEDILNICNKSMRSIREEYGNNIMNFFTIRKTAHSYIYVCMYNSDCIIKHFNNALYTILKPDLKIIL